MHKVVPQSVCRTNCIKIVMFNLSKQTLEFLTTQIVTPIPSSLVHPPLPANIIGSFNI